MINRNYEQIIHLEHPSSRIHPRMSRLDRAAQFAPFAALTGYEEAIDETARRVSDKRELDEESISAINRTLLTLKSRENHHPLAEITWFIPDQLKQGGEYVTDILLVRKIDDINQKLISADGRVIAFADIYQLYLKTEESSYEESKSESHE